MKYQFVKNSVGKLPLNVSDNSKSARDHFFDIHYHDEIEILFVESGERIFYIGEDEEKLSAGDIIIIDSLIPHSTFIYKDQISRLFQFDPVKLTDEKKSKEYIYMFMRRSKNPYTLFKAGEKNTDELTYILNSIARYKTNADKGVDSYIKGYIYILMGFMYKTCVWNDLGESIDENALSGIMKAVRFIEKNYSEILTLDDIAGAMNLNISYFCRLFKKATGSTAIDYLNFVRIQEAKNLLSERGKSIADIAFETGFSNIANFNRTFKKFNSTTPSGYRKLCR